MATSILLRTYRHVLTQKKWNAEGFESVKSMRGIMKNMHQSRLVVPVARGVALI